MELSRGAVEDEEDTSLAVVICRLLDVETLDAPLAQRFEIDLELGVAGVVGRFGAPRVDRMLEVGPLSGYRGYLFLECM